MKRTIAMILILILVLVPTFIQANNTKDQEEIIATILDDLDGSFIKGDISANQKIYQKFLELDVLEGIGYNIEENLEMIEIDKLTQNEKNYNQINFYGYDMDNNQITIILSSYFNEEIDEGQTYLYINFLNKEQFLNIDGIMDNVEYIFNNYGVDAEIATNIEGTIDGKIDFNEYQNRIEKSIEDIDGSILETYENDNLISYNAYTSSIEDYIIIGKDKMNLNIAIRCNKTDDRTVIYIGTPIIAGGY